MTRFTDLPLPKEFSKKKRLLFYKAFLVENKLLEGNDTPVIDINIDSDRFFLSKDIACKMAISSNPDKLEKLTSQIYLSEITLVLLEIDLSVDRYDTVLSYPDGTEPAGGVMYDAAIGALNLTLREKNFNLNIEYFSIENIQISQNSNTHIISVDTLKLREVLVNKK